MREAYQLNVFDHVLGNQGYIEPKGEISTGDPELDEAARRIETTLNKTVIGIQEIKHDGELLWYLGLLSPDPEPSKEHGHFGEHMARVVQLKDREVSEGYVIFATWKGKWGIQGSEGIPVGFTPTRTGMR